jgi:hypothetical protein
MNPFDDTFPVKFHLTEFKSNTGRQAVDGAPGLRPAVCENQPCVYCTRIRCLLNTVSIWEPNPTTRRWNGFSPISPTKFLLNLTGSKPDGGFHEQVQTHKGGERCSCRGWGYFRLCG